MDYDLVEDKVNRAKVNFRIPDLNETLTPNYWGRMGYNRIQEALEHVEEEQPEVYDEFEEELTDLNYESAIEVLE